MPYQSLFQKQTRENLKLDIESSYIIIDEAHNLVDSLNNLYTISLNEEDLTILFSNLTKLRSLVAKKNDDLDIDILNNEKRSNEMIEKVENLKDHIKNLSILINICVQLMNSLKLDSKLFLMNEFQNICKLTEINTFSLLDWVNEHQIIYRLINKLSEEIKIQNSNSIRNFFIFIELMGNKDSQGRVSIEKNLKKITYILLNPSSVFSEILKSKSCCLVGGTLQPFDDLIIQLVDTNLKPKIFQHINDHIIPKENSLTLCFENGPLKNKLNFTYQTKNDINLFNEINESLLQLTNIIPGGIILFFTSFKYLNKFFLNLKNSNYLNKIEKKKLILIETKNSNEVQKIMNRFKSLIDNQKGNFTGAILLAVMNGKLSEGINFSNNYCRCVIIIGMPFSDSNDLILKQRDRKSVV